MKDSIRKRIFKRDNGRCWHCGTDENVVIHHRINRGMGGTSGSLDMPANLIVMCAEFNYLMESDFKAARHARDKGWKVSRHKWASKEPIQDYTGTWFLLDDMFRKWERLEDDAAD